MAGMVDILTGMQRIKSTVAAKYNIPVVREKIAERELLKKHFNKPVALNLRDNVLKLARNMRFAQGVANMKDMRGADEKGAKILFARKSAETVHNYCHKALQATKQSPFLNHLLDIVLSKREKKSLFELKEASGVVSVADNLSAVKDCCNHRKLVLLSKKAIAERKDRSIMKLQKSMDHLVAGIHENIGKYVLEGVKESYDSIAKKIGVKAILVAKERAFKEWEADLKVLETYKNRGDYQAYMRLVESLASKIVLLPLTWRTHLVTDTADFGHFSKASICKLYALLSAYKTNVHNIIEERNVSGWFKNRPFQSLRRAIKTLETGSSDTSKIKSFFNKLHSQAIFGSTKSAFTGLFHDGEVDHRWLQKQIEKPAKKSFKKIDGIAESTLVAIYEKYAGKYFYNPHDMMNTVYSIYSDIRKASGLHNKIHTRENRKYMFLIEDIFKRSCKDFSKQGSLVAFLHDDILAKTGYRRNSIEGKHTLRRVVNEGNRLKLLSNHLMRLHKLKENRTDLEVLLLPNASTYETDADDSFGSVNTLSSLERAKTGKVGKFTKKLDYSVMFINGIQNDYKSAQKSAERIATLFEDEDGKCPDITFVANPTYSGSDKLKRSTDLTKQKVSKKASSWFSPIKDGFRYINSGIKRLSGGRVSAGKAKKATKKIWSFLMDMNEAGSNKAGYITSPGYLLAASIRAQYEKDPFKPILLIAHSQGGAITNNALGLLSANIRSNVHVLAIAPASFVAENRCAECVNVYIPWDFVGAHLNMLARDNLLARNIVARKNPICYIDASKLGRAKPSEDKHAFKNANYQTAVSLAMKALQEGRSIKTYFADIIDKNVTVSGR